MAKKKDDKVNEGLNRRAERFEEQRGAQGKLVLNAYWTVRPLAGAKSKLFFVEYAENFMEELLSELCMENLEGIDRTAFVTELVRRSFFPRQIAGGKVSDDKIRQIAEIISQCEVLFVEE